MNAELTGVNVIWNNLDKNLEIRELLLSGVINQISGIIFEANVKLFRFWKNFMSYDRKVHLGAYADLKMCQNVTEDQLRTFPLRNDDDEISDRQIKRAASDTLEDTEDIDGEPMEEETTSQLRESKQYRRRSHSRSRRHRGSSHRGSRVESVRDPAVMSSRHASRKKTSEHYTSERPDSRLAANEVNGEHRRRRRSELVGVPRYSCSRDRDLRVTENYVTVKSDPISDSQTKEPDPSHQRHEETVERPKKRKRHSSRSHNSHRLNSPSKERSKKRKRRRRSHKKSKKLRRHRSERRASLSLSRGPDEKEAKAPCLPIPEKRRRRHKRTPRSVSPPPLLVEHVDPEEEARQKQDNLIRLAKMKASIVRQAVQLKLQQAKRKEENNEKTLNNKKSSIHSMFNVTDSPEENLKPTKTVKKLYLPRSRHGEDLNRDRRSSRRSYNHRSPERSRRYRHDRIDSIRRTSSPSPSPPPLEPPKPEDEGILNAICHLAEHVVKKDPTIEKKIYDKNIESRGGKRFRFLYEPESLAGKYYIFLKHKLEAQKKKLL